MKRDIKVLAPIGKCEVLGGFQTRPHQVVPSHAQRGLVVRVSRMRGTHFTIEEILLVLKIKIY